MAAVTNISCIITRHTWQFTYFDLEMAEKEKVARQMLYTLATTKIQHRTESENRD